MTDSHTTKLRTLIKSDETRRKEPPPAPPAPPSSSPTSPAPAEKLDSSLQKILEEPRSIETTHIPPSFLADLALKTLYFGGTMPGGRIAHAMRLHFGGVVEPTLRNLKADHLVEITGGGTLNPGSYLYSITNKGGERARELLERNRYVGPCPVSLNHYIKVVKAQAERRPTVNDADVRQAMKGLILSDDVLDYIGPAVNSHESIFVYGPPGNGKTSIARAIGLGLLPGNVMVPHAIYEDGQIIKVFDPTAHEVIGSEASQLAEANNLDKRWVRCSPPIIVTGGELTLSDLDLVWSDTSRFYEAPFQVKANGGMLVIDDFGRQQMPPTALLNRWIVPLEDKIDFLTFHTGKKITIPFEALIVFSTNLDPKSLVDEAFLRRISHKLGIYNPDKEQYREILVAACAARGVEFEENAFNYLLQKYYADMDRPLRACHPRDLLKQMITFASYRGEPLVMSKELTDRAARSYFADFL